MEYIKYFCLQIMEKNPVIFLFFFFFSIEKCLKDLQSDVNEIRTDEVLQSTTDCIQWLNNCNFSSLRPSSTDHGELLEFLKTLVKIFIKDFNVGKLD